ncbi:MAG TPA: hypothetical protein VF435_02545 [Pyrinomonadaceae bacterium]
MKKQSPCAFSIFFRRFFISRYAGLPVIACIGVLFLSLAVWASIPSANGVIHGCYDTSKGTLRLIDNAVTQCKTTESAISWSQTGPQGPIGPTGPQGPQGAQGPTGTANIPSSRSFLLADAAIQPSPSQQQGVPINWDVVQYDTLGAIQLQPWRYVAPTSGRYRVSTFIRYRPNGLIAAGQVVQVEVYVNGSDEGGLGGFQASSETNGADLFLQGEDEVLASAGAQITINLFQNTGHVGYVTTASHVLIERVGN